MFDWLFDSYLLNFIVIGIILSTFTDYAKNMEKEIKLLKAEKRDLRNQLELAMKENRTHIQQGNHKQESINLTDQTRTHSHEIAMLKQQIAKLESSLQNSKVEALENQVREMFQFSVVLSNHVN